MKVTAIALLALGFAGIASASDLCSVAEADRQPMEALQTKLEGEGWQIKKIKLDEGCYEAYAVTAEGKKVEAFFDPQTFELIKMED